MGEDFVVEVVYNLITEVVSGRLGIDKTFGRD